MATTANICGYDARGNARTAMPSVDCRVDTANGLWAFCPETVVAAYDCGMAGYCIDEHDCRYGCGPLKDRPGITTFTW